MEVLEVEVFFGGLEHETGAEDSGRLGNTEILT